MRVGECGQERVETGEQSSLCNQQQVRCLIACGSNSAINLVMTAGEKDFLLNIVPFYFNLSVFFFFLFFLPIFFISRLRNETAEEKKPACIKQTLVPGGVLG